MTNLGGALSVITCGSEETLAVLPQQPMEPSEIESKNHRTRFTSHDYEQTHEDAMLQVDKKRNSHNLAHGFCVRYGSSGTARSRSWRVSFLVVVVAAAIWPQAEERIAYITELTQLRAHASASSKLSKLNVER
jgi:hypothetical protein